jgi:acyl dehydratase
MAVFDAKIALPGDEPGPWGAPVPIAYDKRDVLLYAVGVGSHDLRFIYEGAPGFAVFPTFPIRWSGAGAPIDRTLVPVAPGPLMVDAERLIEVLRPMPVEGRVSVVSRLLAAHPKSKGSALVEMESQVLDEAGNICVRMINGVFIRGIQTLGDIEPFEGAGTSQSVSSTPPDRPADHEMRATIAVNQAHIYRLSGDYNPLHIDPAAARFGGFDKPILHGLCTLGTCARLLLEQLCEGDPSRFRRFRVRFSSPVLPGDELTVRAWKDQPGRVLFDARIGERTVISNAWFEYE